jgi:hypothetical protein
MTFFRYALASTATLLALAPFGSAIAEPHAPPSPPREAFDACSNAKDGDACAVSVHGHEVKGICAPFRDQGLVCRPAGPPPGPPPGRHHGPPPGAFEACSGANDGDACSVKLPDHEMKGICAPFGDQGLACRPSGPPPGR